MFGEYYATPAQAVTFLLFACQLLTDAAPYYWYLNLNNNLSISLNTAS
jgi:hypothetical protein